jgi:hypothetical protein
MCLQLSNPISHIKMQWLLLNLKRSLQNAMQSKLHTTLQPHFPTAFGSSIIICVHVKVCHQLCTLFASPISTLVSPLCISCYVFFILIRIISYFELCVVFHFIPFYLYVRDIMGYPLHCQPLI